MDHGSGGGGRSSSRLRDRLARMFRPGTLLRSTCNTTASTCSSTSTAVPGGGGSSSRALLAAVASRDSRVVEDAFLASSRRDYVVGRTESFSTSVDRLRRRVAVVAPALPSRFSIDDAPSPPLLGERVDKEMERIDKQTTAKLKLLSNDPYGFSSSDDTTNAAVFSSDADEDLAGGRVDGANKKLGAETFFSSSRSFSSDSSEFYATKKKKTKATGNRINKSPAAAAPPPNKYNKPPLPPSSAAGTRRASWKTKEQQRPRRRAASSSCDTCGVRDGFRPVVVSAAEDQLRKGFAVVKRSPDPYADFRSSMVEMIVGRQLFGERELERLLRSYLTLNAPRHHPVILQAFSDIWVVLHGG